MGLIPFVTLTFGPSQRHVPRYSELRTNVIMDILDNSNQE